MNAFHRRLSFALCATLFSIGASHASVVYTYTGANFQNFGTNTVPTHAGAVFEQSDKLLFQITLSGSLPVGTNFNHWENSFGSSTSVSNYQGASNPTPAAPVVESWFVSIGAVTLSGGASRNINFSISQDFNGDIASWQILANETRPSGSSAVVDTGVFSHGVPSSRALVEYASTCLGDIACLDSGNYASASTNTAGAWTIAAANPFQVPSPSSASLLMAGLFGAAFLRKRSKSTAAAPSTNR